MRVFPLSAPRTSSYFSGLILVNHHFATWLHRLISSLTETFLASNYFDYKFEITLSLSLLSPRSYVLTDLLGIAVRNLLTHARDLQLLENKLEEFEDVTLATNPIETTTTTTTRKTEPSAMSSVSSRKLNASFNWTITCRERRDRDRDSVTRGV